MKALTVREPYASLIAIGAKQIETRDWYTFYRGPIAIHAAKGLTKDDLMVLSTHDDVYWRLHNASIPMGKLKRVKDSFPDSRGNVIATATLVNCYRMTEESIRQVPIFEWVVGHYQPDRYAWVLADVVRLPEPIPARGALGLWEWEPPAELRGTA